MEQYDCVIIGGGVTGAALLHVLARYSDIGRVALVEKYGALAQVNSASWNNSQTLHFGDIETNYSFEKAKKVKRAAEMVRRYLERHDDVTHSKGQKMVLAVGREEVAILEHRYRTFRHLYPGLRKVDRDGLRDLEPNVVRGREPEEELLALVSDDGYSVDFGSLARSFVADAVKHKEGVDLFLSTPVKKIVQEDGGYTIYAPGKRLRTKTVVVAAGGESLSFAYRLGLGRDWILLPVAGSFFCADNVLHGKVYTLQTEKLPFAAVHGDPDVHQPGQTRFGPTAKVLPVLERRNLSTFWSFLRLFEFRIDAVVAILNILSDPVMYRFVLRNVLYDLPLIGRVAFLGQVRKIVPTMRLSQLHSGKGLGGIRPQVVSTRKQAAELGEARIVGQNSIFNITPSPGASTCLQNAAQDAKTIAEMLGCRFDQRELQRELG